MGKRHVIRIRIKKPGRGESAVELEYCPLEENGICRLELVKCNYGLTEIKVPSPVCPMSGKTVVTLEFSAI